MFAVDTVATVPRRKAALTGVASRVVEKDAPTTWTLNPRSSCPALKNETRISPLKRIPGQRWLSTDKRFENEKAHISQCYYRRSEIQLGLWKAHAHLLCESASTAAPEQPFSTRRTSIRCERVLRAHWFTAGFHVECFIFSYSSFANQTDWGSTGCHGWTAGTIWLRITTSSVPFFFRMLVCWTKLTKFTNRCCH